MSEDEETTSTDQTNILKDAQNRFNEYKDRFNSSETGQELKDIYGNINTELKRLGKLTANTVSKQAKDLQTKFEDLQENISSRIQETDQESHAQQ